MDRRLERHSDAGLYFAFTLGQVCIIIITFPYTDPGGERDFRFGKAKGQDNDSSLPFYLPVGWRCSKTSRHYVLKPFALNPRKVPGKMVFKVEVGKQSNRPEDCWSRTLPRSLSLR